MRKLKNKAAQLKEKVSSAKNAVEREYYEAELECVYKLMEEEKERKKAIREENARGWI